MAKATKIPEDNYTVNLELSPMEARTLLKVLRRVGGHPLNTARGYAEEVELALENAGVKPLYPDDIGDNNKCKGTVTFTHDYNLRKN